jgi:hypothetical protein
LYSFWLTQPYDWESIIFFILYLLYLLGMQEDLVCTYIIFARDLAKPRRVAQPLPLGVKYPDPSLPLAAVVYDAYRPSTYFSCNL